MHMSDEQQELRKATIHDLLVLPILKNEPSGHARKRTHVVGTGLIPLKRIKREPVSNYTAGIHGASNTTATSSAMANKRRK